MKRRQFLQVASAGALGLSLLSEACAPTAPSTPAAPAAAPTGATTAGAAKPPTYVAFQGPKPDLPGTADGLDI